MTARFELTVA